MKAEVAIYKGLLFAFYSPTRVRFFTCGARLSSSRNSWGIKENGTTIGGNLKCKERVFVSQILIGISGFSYPDWKGPVYPKDLKNRGIHELEYIAPFFDF